MRQPMIPATPSTSAQQARYSRVLQSATSMLRSGGEDMLQMKELAQRADVSLDTLYRYFPSKDHVLLAIAHNRYSNALGLVSNESVRGATTQERVTNHLLREFRAGQRDQQLTAALTRVLADTRAEHRDTIQGVKQLHMKVLQQVAVGGRPVTEEQLRRLKIVEEVFAAATRRWLAGISSAAEARFEIRVGAYLLAEPDFSGEGRAGGAVAAGRSS